MINIDPSKLVCSKIGIQTKNLGMGGGGGGSFSFQFFHISERFCSQQN